MPKSEKAGLIRVGNAVFHHSEVLVAVRGTWHGAESLFIRLRPSSTYHDPQAVHEIVVHDFGDKIWNAIAEYSIDPQEAPDAE